MATRLRLADIRALRYRMPLKRAYGTARGLTKAGVNFLVQLTAEQAGQTIVGVGECQPRHALTGDGGKDRVAAWGFLCAAADYLHGRTLEFNDGENAISQIREIMAEINSLAVSHAADSNRDRPFRGTMLGIEVALLDVVARSLGLEIAELLGKKRDRIEISISTVSSSTKIEDVPGKVIKQTRFPITRVKGIGDLDYDLELMTTVNRANHSVGRDKPIWIDINEALNPAQASQLVTEVVARMARDELPHMVVMEGLVPKVQVTCLPELQRQADHECRAVANGRNLDLRIMPDEGMWDVNDLAVVNEYGGCRALNIKAPKAGGLLASLDLANAAVAADPDIHVCIGGMIGTSDITAWALHNLARALPRVDYLTTVPPTNVKERIGQPVTTYVDKGSNVIAPQREPGLGTRLDLAKVMPYVEEIYDPSDEPSTGAARRPVTPLEIVDRAPAPGNQVPVRTLTFAGDTSLGDVHINAKGGELLKRLDEDPMSFFAGLRPLVSEQDALIVNLETVLADSPRSPFEGRKRYLGWDSPGRAVSCLQELGVDAVNLANNHTMDFGSEHLLAMRRLLEDKGIRAFGAGPNDSAASAPLTLRFDMDSVEHTVHVIGTMQVQRRLRDDFQFYATADSAGVGAMSVRRLSARIEELRAKDPGALIVVFPHWGGNYVWVKDSAQQAASAFFEAGADLIIGHGAHMLQQCTFGSNSAAVYSLGNFVFNWAGRFAKFDAPPYGIVARVALTPRSSAWDVNLRLYPTVCDNTLTSYSPRPVHQDEFESMWSALRDVDLDGSFADQAIPARDHLGLHIAYSFNTGDHRAESKRSGVGRLSPLKVLKRSKETESTAQQSPKAPSEAFSPGSTTQLLAQAVIDRGLPHRVEQVAGRASSPERLRTALRFSVKDRDYFVRTGTIIKARPDGTPGAGIDGRAVKICSRKDITKGILDRAGFSIPAGMSFSRGDLRGALLYFEAIAGDSPHGVCIKPASGNKGRSIHLDITDRQAFRAAFEGVAAGFDTVLVEESVRGDVLRFLSIGGKVVAVRRGVPANVVGDGRRTIAELAEEKNEVLRRRGADRHTLVKLGEQVQIFLAGNGWSLSSIPDDGDRIFLSSLSNRHAAAEVVDCTDAVHPSYIRTVERATSHVPDLVICGADVMVDDFTAPATDKNHHFIELNTTPGLRGHHAPSEGVPRDIASMIIDFVVTYVP